MDDFQWLEHPETGGKAEFHYTAVPLWIARGWELTDAPDEPDLTKDPDTEAPDEPGLSAVEDEEQARPKKTTKRAVKAAAPSQEK